MNMRRVLLLLGVLLWSASAVAAGEKAEDLAQIKSQLAIEYAKIGNLKVALESAEQAVKENSSLPLAYIARAYVLSLLQQDSQAERDYQKALRLDPSSPEANNNYGLFLCEREKAAESLAYFEKALENPLNTTPQSAILNLGRCYFKLGKTEEANRYLLRAIQVSPGYRPALIELVKVHLALINGKLAEFYFNQVKNSGAVLSAEELWLGVQIARRLGDHALEANYSNELKQRYPGAQETQYLLGG